MAAKRVRDHSVDSPPDPATLSDDKVEALTDFARPVYLVAPHMSKQPPAYSVFVVDAAAVADGGDEPPRARTVSGLRGPKRAMSFVATHSEQGSWIVGVGGRIRGRNTVIYDPSTMKTIPGPDLWYPKRKPILISLGSKVYAISRRPCVRDSKYDLQPWVESLSFRKGVPSISGQDLHTWNWKPLGGPPIFPYCLDPMEYRYPPRISVSSYATIDSYILLSLDDHEAGTYAFHVGKKTWEKVCNEGLPFVGQAVTLGAGLFAACCTINSHTTAAIFHMSIKGSSSPVACCKLTTSLLSTLERPPAALSMGDSLPLLCPMGKGNFCSIWLESSGRINRAGRVKKDLRIILTTSKIDNMEAILTACQTQSAEAKDDLQVLVQVKYQNRTYKLHGPSPLKNSPMPVIASLYMEREVAELFEVERIKKKAREAVATHVFEAVVIRRRRL